MNNWIKTDIKKGGHIVFMRNCSTCDSVIYERKNRISKRVFKDLCSSCASRARIERDGSAFHSFVKKLKEENKTQVERIKALEDALMFYANKENYITSYEDGNCILHEGLPLKDTIDMEDCDPCGGKMAREVLGLM